VAKPQANGVQSVERAFTLLEVLAGAGGELSLSEIAAESGLPLPTIHRLTSLVEELGETANFGTLDGDRATYIAQVPSRHSMRMFTEVGRRVPLHCTGVGKALLAQLDDKEVDALVRRTGLPAETTYSITDPDVLAGELRKIREQGFAVDDGEQEIGVRCVAVPVLGIASGFAISVSGPTARMNDELIDRAVPLLKTVAKGLAADLASR
jgi:IclR family acetate operon transcriptional repressor